MQDYFKSFNLFVPYSNSFPVFFSCNPQIINYGKGEESIPLCHRIVQEHDNVLM